MRAAVSAHIESPRDALRWRHLNVRGLCRGTTLDALATAISGCKPEKLCRQVLCPTCARRYRLWRAAEILVHASHGLPACALTILLRQVRGRDLHRVHLKAEHELLRKRLARAGFKAVAGGTEASYDADEDLWTVHVHLIVFGEIDDALPKLRKIFKRDGLHRSIVREELHDVVGWVTYSQKFVTYHRPGSAQFGGRGRAYPLKSRQIIQLARWTGRYRFEDFLFLLGFRRRGAQIVAEPGFTKMLRDHQRRVATWRRGDARKILPA
jgi:hypothetical protein